MTVSSSRRCDLASTVWVPVAGTLLVVVRVTVHFPILLSVCLAAEAFELVPALFVKDGFQVIFGVGNDGWFFVGVLPK